MVVKLALLYGVKCWPIKKTKIQILKVAEIRMIRWMCGYIRLDKLKNMVIREKVGVALIEDKIKETTLRWFRLV